MWEGIGILRVYLERKEERKKRGKKRRREWRKESFIMFHGDFVEQFVGFFAKAEEIFGGFSVSHAHGRPIFINIRILFHYTDNSRELCGGLKVIDYG